MDSTYGREDGRKIDIWCEGKSDSYIKGQARVGLRYMGIKEPRCMAGRRVKVQVGRAKRRMKE